MKKNMTYRIDGYDLETALNITTSSDRESINSFEQPRQPKERYSYNWPDEDGTEYDLDSPIVFEKRDFLIKGNLYIENPQNYGVAKIALEYLLFQNYLTIEVVELGIKVNAKLKSSGLKWNRITNLDFKNPILVEVEFRFDEIIEDIPYKEDGGQELRFLTNSVGDLYQTQGGKYIITS